MTPSTDRIEVRVRSLGEVLDDAWRWFLRDLAPLLCLSTLFAAPWTAALYWSLTRPPAEAGWFWAGLAAGMLLIGAVGPGACQEWLRHRAAARPPTVAACIRAAFALMPQHVLMRIWALLVPLAAVVLTYKAVETTGLPRNKWIVGILMGVMVVTPSLIVWAMAIPGHALLAAHGGTITAAHRAARKEVFRQFGKVFKLAVSRAAIFILAAVNLDALFSMILVVVDEFFGVDVAFAFKFLSWSNPAYFWGLMFFTYLVLSPYFEVVNYLFHLDARARYEGLDLWYRVQRHFALPSKDIGPSKAVAAVLIGAIVLLLPGSASAAAPPPPIEVSPQGVANVRRIAAEVAEIRGRMEVSAEATFDGKLYSDQLTTLVSSAAVQHPHTPKRVRDWLADAADKVVDVRKETALKAVHELEDKLLAFLRVVEKPEKYPDKELVKELALGQPQRPKPKPKATEPPPPPPPPPPQRPPDPPPRNPNQAPPRPAAAPPAPVTVAASTGGMTLLWTVLILCGALLLLLLGYSVYRAWRNRRRQPKKVKQAKVVEAQTHPEADAIEELLSAPVKGSNPWMEADQLAQSGQPAEALRLLYLKLLVLLHRANLIRYERMRTNGEYIRMLRSRPEVQKPFRQLTHVFELKWYGKRPCEVGEYYACRDLADQIHGESQRHG